MALTSLHILPVYSKLHPTATIHTVRLLQHQHETLEAFRNPDIDVITNMAMTGDGKSLAAYLAAIQDQLHVIAMYPTNELISDQYAALPSYEQNLGIPIKPFDTMYSEKITQLMRLHQSTNRLEEVRKLLVKNRMILTNPDLLHLIMSHQYGWEHLRKELPVTIGAFFDYFIFDEFHIFNVPQVIAIINILGYLTTGYRDKARERKKFVFLSATPNTQLHTLLQRGGIRYQSIQGTYRSSPQGEDYRCILQACDLEFHEVSQEREHSTEQWIEEHLETLLHFFIHYPGSKAAILVSSVATARRIYTRIKAYFEPYGITVGENTGLTNREERELSRTRDILVGTSTVDVGVDFHINYLIFEASSAGTFLQRFGRLGRHGEFPIYRAHALVPRFVLERVQAQITDEMEREALNKMIYDVFPTEQQFSQYCSLWGTVQAAQVVAELQSQRKLDANQAFTDALVEQYERTYATGDKPVMSKALKKYWRIHKEAPEIIQELRSFRGQSPLSCAVWDTDNHLKTYELFFLLSNTEFEVLDTFTFMQEVRARGLEERTFEKQLLYLKIHDYIPERLQLILQVPYDITPFLNRIQVLHGITIQSPHPVWRDKVNFKLKHLKLPAIVTDIERAALKQKLQLGPLFPVYHLHDVTGGRYSISFGQEALLLDSLLFFRKPQGDKPMLL
ncbi:type I-D CRISPR-associated helicase Cas3' [Dictyobacter aurantiacus]|uniref:Helicase ATP-binding domain-containing protein n=1 Tax=Dictyobacter aurantiacus TaxID=1936993 RepID=A0A401ZQZ3_9CHLR|nr:type I-D CRISPR-associated helicase Cas3' [Dictyobacter aurantiacus]GCE09289.1 hypothetical protein KDAU_66180 [Dictyobacter aurantiacus]